jgi:hypothetical protein
MSSIDVTIDQINAAAAISVVALSLINFVLGAIGLMFNIVVFTRPSLRKEPCSLYFFSSTCFNLFVVFVVMPVRIVSNGFNIDLANYNLGICKVEYFAFRAGRTIPCWLTVLACLDRYLHSSTKAHIRRMSSLKTAKLAIKITTVAITLSYSHTLAYYEITNVSNQFNNIVPSCNGQTGIYRTFSAFWYLAMYSLCPSFLMLLFGSLALGNLRRHRRKVSPAPGSNQIARRTDMQLGRMLIAQVLVIVISTLPFSIYQLYSSFTSNLTKSSLRIAQENLASGTANALTYFAHSSSFYLYTLTGTIFRKEVFKIIRRCWHLNRNILPTILVGSLEVSVTQRNRQIPGTPIASKQCHSKAKTFSMTTEV